MVTERVLAVINSETREIINKIVFHDLETVANMVFPNNVIVVEATQYDVEIGDKFTEEGFSKSGQILYPRVTLEQQIEILTEKLEVTQAALDELLM